MTGKHLHYFIKMKNKSRQNEQDPDVQWRDCPEGIPFSRMIGRLYINPLITQLLDKTTKQQKTLPRFCCRFVTSAEKKKLFFTQL